MSVQEPVLRSVQINVGWRTPPRFPEVRGQLTDAFLQFTEDSESWFWDSDSAAGMVVAYNEEKRLHVLATPEGLDIVSETPDIDFVTSTAEALIGECMQILNVRTLGHAAGGAFWTLAAEDAGAAEQALEAWLLAPHTRTRLDAIGGRPDDIMLTLRFETDNGVTTVLKTEPLTDQQAADGPFFLTSIDASELPPAMLYVSLNRRQTGEFTADEASSRGRRYLQQTLEHGDRLLATLESRDDGSNEA